MASLGCYGQRLARYEKNHMNPSNNELICKQNQNEVEGFQKPGGLGWGSRLLLDAKQKEIIFDSPWSSTGPLSLGLVPGPREAVSPSGWRAPGLPLACRENDLSAGSKTASLENYVSNEFCMWSLAPESDLEAER